MAVPSRALLDWVARAVGPGARVVGVEDLKARQGPQPVWRVRLEHPSSTPTTPTPRSSTPRSSTPRSSTPGTVEAVLKAGPLAWAEAFASEAAGLRFAAEQGLPVPELIDVDVQGSTGVLAILTTVAEGRPWRPREDPAPERLETLGAMAARLHAIPLEPRRGLPRRTRPMPHDDYVAERRWAARYRAAPPSERERVLADVVAESGWSEVIVGRVVTQVTTTPLLEEAEQRIASIPEPETPLCFVHGDLHIGNALWLGGRVSALVDWDGAGCGHPGIDLASLRLDAALYFGLPAAERVVRGWEAASGRAAADLAYWDVVAALQSPAQIGARALRDRFLRAALERL